MKSEKEIEVYRGYRIVKTRDSFEVRDKSGKVITWSYGLKGARFFVDDLISEKETS